MGLFVAQPELLQEWAMHDSVCKTLVEYRDSYCISAHRIFWLRGELGNVVAVPAFSFPGIFSPRISRRPPISNPDYSRASVTHELLDRAQNGRKFASCARFVVHLGNDIQLRWGRRRQRVEI